jgi:glutathione S-transferase
MATTPPILWHFPISHFNEKVRWALDFKRIPHVRRALGFNYLFKAWRATGQGSLPILFLDGKAISDSTRIIEALERFKPDPALYPRDESQRRRALDLEEFFDEELGHHARAVIIGPLFAEEPDAAINVLGSGMTPQVKRVMRMVLPAFGSFYQRRHHITPESVKLGRAKVSAGLDRIAAELQPSGYLVGDSFSVADLTAAALLTPIVSPPEFEYRVAGAPPRVIQEYRDSLAQHPAFRWAEDMYRRHRGTSAEVAA